MPPNLDALPEPSDLHAHVSVHRSLDWGDRIPSRAQIAAEFGEGPTARSLAMLARAAAVERGVTDEFMSAVQPGTVAYQLSSRMKSPQSLARKLRMTEDYRSSQPPEDLLRYTVVAPEPDDLIDAAAATLRELRSNGWEMHSAHHSYLDGSRYKGLHTFLQCHGELVELQIHSKESIEVKNRTTSLYEIERDPRQGKEARDVARAACIRLSDAMRLPAGIMDLTELGGVHVATRSYGRRSSRPAAGPGVAEVSAKTPMRPGHSAKVNRADGMSR